jgi:hypothetical protein
MKRVDEELWEPIPERGNRVCERESLRLYIALRAEVENLVCSVLVDSTFADTFCTINCLAFRTIPQCRSARMVLAICFHCRFPSLCRYMCVDLGGAGTQRSHRESVLLVPLNSLCKNGAVPVIGHTFKRKALMPGSRRSLLNF